MGWKAREAITSQERVPERCWRSCYKGVAREAVTRKSEVVMGQRRVAVTRHAGGEGPGRS